MTGTTWVDESGLLTSPVLITNTHSVGMVHHATLQWMVANQPDFLWALPVVAETWDGVLNDINGFHVQPPHVVAALEGARGGPIAEGAVGGGTGMICHGFKGGIGTASRRLPASEGGHTVGVLVQCNYGLPRALTVAGVPVGETLIEEGFQGRCLAGERPPTRDWLAGLPACDGDPSPQDETGVEGAELGSIIIIVATDAAVLPHQLERIIKRSALGLGRVGSVAGNGSGDIFLAFSTAGAAGGPAGGQAAGRPGPGDDWVGNDQLDPLFRATVEATEEAIINALVAARSMTGADDVRVRALPHERLREILAAYGRLADSN
jgi:L-aminopeptidase/D-esterase-like protein